MEDELCRILTISSSGSGALAFIESLKALAASHPTSSDSGPPLDSSSIPFTVPWTIANRYYTADVHFSAWTVDKLFAELFERQPPTVVYVWFDGEPYAKHVAEVARLMKLKDYEPEVALAVRIPAPVAPSSPSGPLKKVGKDADGLVDQGDNGDIDNTLMSYGFEYVDATRPFMKVSGGSRTDEDIEDDIPALPRVLDALSTIMWPSMRSTKERGVGGPERLPAGRALLDLNRSFDDMDSEDEDLKQDSEKIVQELLRESASGSLSLFGWEKKVGGEGQTRHGDVDEEDEELMEQMMAFVMDAESKKSPHWISTSSSTTTCGSEVTTSPTEMYAEDNTMSPFRTQQATFNGNLDGEEGTASKDNFSLRFDDDFTVFVSAPPALEQSKPAVSLTSFDSSGSLAPDVGFRYRSLGSVSDFGDDYYDGESVHVVDPLEDVGSDSNGSEDSAMPSKVEIKDTARRIFGARQSSTDTPDEDGRRGFDLEHVFGVLQGYKHEIAAMTDEEEKRKAAAKVALGLVYGLEGKK